MRNKESVGLGLSGASDDITLTEADTGLSFLVKSDVIDALLDLPKKINSSNAYPGTRTRVFFNSSYVDVREPTQQVLDAIAAVI